MRARRTSDHGDARVSVHDWAVMDLIPRPPGRPTPSPRCAGCVASSRRERARRQAAESIGERATADLYDSVRELRSAQADLLERADQTRVVNELARALRQDLDSAPAGQPGRRVRRPGDGGRPLRRAARRRRPLLRGAGHLEQLDETAAAAPAALVRRPARGAHRAAARGRPAARAAPDRPRRGGPAARRRRARTRSSRPSACASLAAVPVAVGDEVVGWLLLQSVAPRAVAATRARHLRGALARPGLLADPGAGLRAAARVRAAARGARPGQGRLHLDGLPRAAHPADQHRRLPRDDDRGRPRASSTTVSPAGCRIIERNVGPAARPRRGPAHPLGVRRGAGPARPRSRSTSPAVVAECAAVRCSRRSHRQASSSCVLVAEPGLPAALADRTQIERVVLNLLSNAIEVQPRRRAGDGPPAAPTATTSC